MKKIIQYSALALVLLVASCSNPINKKIDIKTVKEDLAEIKKDNAKQYTEQDFEAVGKLIARQFMATALSGDKNPTLNIEQTYKALLDEAKTIRLQKEKEELEYQAKLNELKKVLSIAITSTNLQKVGDFIPIEYLVFNYTTTNKSKNIKGWTGSLKVKDMFDKLLGSFELEQKDVLKTNETQKREAAYNADYETDFKEIGNTDITKLKFVFEPKMIIFEDGTLLEAPSRKTE